MKLMIRIEMGNIDFDTDNFDFLNLRIKIKSYGISFNLIWN